MCGFLYFHAVRKMNWVQQDMYCHCYLHIALLIFDSTFNLSHMKSIKYLSSVMLLAILSIYSHAQTIVYVKKTATGSNNGTSWTNAYVDLKAALLAAPSGAHVWIAADTFYIPAASGGRGVSFEILNKSLTLWGGFPNTGNPNSTNQRVPSIYRTILSGDIGRNDTVFTTDTRKTDTRRTDNAYNVIRISLSGASTYSVTIDGCWIQDGNASGANDGSEKFGAGIYCIRNATGSGTHTITVRNCVIRNNTAGSSAAIAPYFYYINNGTNIYNIHQNKIYNNIADEWAVTGLHIPGSNGLTSYGLNFLSNSVYRNISLGSNTAVLGAVCRNNSDQSSSFVYNIHWNTFTNNNSGASGGVICGEGTQGITPGNVSQIRSTNNIFWGNTPARAHYRRLGARAYSYTCYYAYNMAEVNDSLLSTDTLYHNIWGNPKFEGAVIDNYRLTPCSRAINSGSTTIPDGGGGSFSISASGKDVEDNTRTQQSIIDRGAYEFFGTASGPSASSISVDICPGTMYSFKGQNLTTPGTYRDTLNNVSGCDSVVTLTLTLKPNSNDTMPVFICEGDSFNFNNNYYKQTGFHSGNFTNVYGCDSIKTINLTVNNKPQPTIVRNGAQLEVTGGSFDSYQWKLNGNNISGANFATHTPVSNGTYTVSVSKSANNISCNNTSADYSVGFVGLEEFSLITGVKFYPNPTKGLLTIEVTKSSPIVIMNLLGKVLISETVTDKAILNLQHLPKGIYFISETNKKAVSKIVLQ